MASEITTRSDLAEVPLNLPLKISGVLQAWAGTSPNNPALIESSGTWTYGQLSNVVAEAQGWLVSLGIRPGDRVMVICENCRVYVAVLLALAEVDAWPVLVNARLSAREVDQIRDHCGARLVIYTTAVSHQAKEHAKRHGALIQNAGSLGQVAVGTIDETAVPEGVDPDVSQCVAALIYTSVTTGLPKGVMLTHQNLLFVASVSAHIRSLTAEDRLYGVLPMSHAVGL